MKTKLLPIAAILALASTGAQAHPSAEKGDIMAEGTSAYVVDSMNHIVRDNYNRCVRSSDWTKETAIAKCEGWDEAPMAEEKAAPAPVAAPVAPPKFIGHFAFDLADLKSAEVPDLDAFATYMNEVADSKIAITGHTDSTGPEAYNQMLSEKRAQDVADYLASKGISADRMTVSGMGESAPVADNSTTEGRAANRRVEVEIVE